MHMDSKMFTSPIIIYAFLKAFQYQELFSFCKDYWPKSMTKKLHQIEMEKQENRLNLPISKSAVCNLRHTTV